jgi:hypothetical protein
MSKGFIQLLDSGAPRFAPTRARRQWQMLMLGGCHPAADRKHVVGPLVGYSWGKPRRI